MPHQSSSTAKSDVGGTRQGEESNVIKYAVDGDFRKEINISTRIEEKC